MDHKILIGQRINLTSNKKGTLRYYGCVSFASGIWCGIELDEADGDNDGSVDNVYYFTCEKNHGIFCCISQVLSNFSLPGNVPFDEYIKFHQHDLLPDADKKFKKLSTISQESCVTSKPFENLSGLDVEINVPSASEDFVDTYEDSDESLGILSLDLLDDSNELFYENFLKDDSEHDFIDSIIKTNNPLMKLPDLSTSHSDELQCDLNAVNIIKSDEFKSAAIKINADRNCQSPKALLCSKFEESPTLKTVMSPKYSSTPKHDTTFVFDDRFFNSEQNLSPVSNLNKTYYKEDTLQDKIMLANIDKLNPTNVISVETPVFYPKTDKNILNITCNISTPLHHQGKQNNTFNAANEMNVTIYPEDEKKTFILKENKSAEIQITPSDNEKGTTDENIQKVLNTNISLPDELGYKFEVLNLEECGNTSESTLNVLARPKDFENPLYEEGIMTNVFDKTQILNTTYEKIDELQLSKMNECSDVYKEVGMTKISKIAKSIDSSLFSNIACNKSDKKSIRKNNFVSSKNNTKTFNKESLKRKQTFGSTPIKNDCNVIDQNLISQRTSDLSSCKSEVSLSHYNKFKFKEEKRSTVSLKSVSKQKKN